jgi:hypothetical protein
MVGPAARGSRFGRRRLFLIEVTAAVNGSVRDVVPSLEPPRGPLLPRDLLPQLAVKVLLARVIIVVRENLLAPRIDEREVRRNDLRQTRRKARMSRKYRLERTADPSDLLSVAAKQHHAAADHRRRHRCRLEKHAFLLL